MGGGGNRNMMVPSIKGTEHPLWIIILITYSNAINYFAKDLALFTFHISNRVLLQSCTSLSLGQCCCKSLLYELIPCRFITSSVSCLLADASVFLGNSLSTAVAHSYLKPGVFSLSILVHFFFL